jgi:SRSO17 transposase
VHLLREELGEQPSDRGPQQRRFAAYVDSLAKTAGHADREIPLRNYGTGLLLPGERKSVEAMAA